MKERGLVVLSGIGTKVVDRFVRQLNANGIESAFVQIRGDLLDDAYFDRLLSQTLVSIGRVQAKGECRVTALLVSAIEDEAGRAREKSLFFPALRRLPIKAEWKNNVSAADKIRDAVLGHFQSDQQKEFWREVSPTREPRLLLPTVNTRLKALKRDFEAIYKMDSIALTRRVYKDVVKLRGSKTLRVRGIDFSPTINNGRHPVRRCSQSKKCDLEASFRFGAAVPDRFEFDVSSPDALKRKTFCQCDGECLSLNIEPTHLNMRINNDFGIS